MEKRIVIALMSTLALFQLHAMNIQTVQISDIHQTRIGELRKLCFFGKVKNLIKQVEQNTQSSDSALLEKISLTHTELTKSLDKANSILGDKAEDAFVRNEIRRERSVLKRDFIKTCIPLKARLENLRADKRAELLLQYLEQNTRQ